MKKLTVQEFSDRIRERFPEEHFEIIEYRGTGEPLIVKCLECKKVIQVSKAVNFLAKNKRYGCKHCHGLWIEREKLWKEINKRYTVEFLEVRGTHKFYRFVCRDCGHERISNLGRMRVHLECGCKTNNIHRTEEEFKKDLPNKYILLSSFEGMTKKVLVKCRDCGFLWKVRPADIIYSGASCPHCNNLASISKGEKLIQDFLDIHSIEFIREQNLPGTLMRFDFWLPKYSTVIEYNGRQHYHYIKFFHQNNSGFKKMKERDRTKKEYCETHSITFLEIPYTWKEATVVKFLSDYFSSTTIE